jgi:hypothetical protein
VGQRQGGKIQTIASTGFGENALQVSFHGVLADSQLAGNFPVPESAGHGLRNAPFPLRESLHTLRRPFDWSGSGLIGEG